MRIKISCTFMALLISITSCKKAAILSGNNPKTIKEYNMAKPLGEGEGLPDGETDLNGDEDYSQSYSTEDSPNSIFCYSNMRYPTLQSLNYPSVHAINWWFSTDPESNGKGTISSNNWYGGSEASDWIFTTTYKTVYSRTAYIDYELQEVWGGGQARYTITSETKWEGSGTFSSVMKWTRHY